MLLDIWMPDTDGISLLREWQQAQSFTAPVVMMSGHGTVETAVEATRLGAVDYVEKPLSLAKLLRTVQKALDDGRRRRHSARALVPPLIAPIGRSQLMRELREQVRQVAPHEAPVLMLGEPGTGREAFARYIHSLSARSGGPFVTAVAGALTEGDLEANLYGVGNGGEPRKGVLEQAEGGDAVHQRTRGSLRRRAAAVACRARHGQLPAQVRHELRCVSTRASSPARSRDSRRAARSPSASTCSRT